MPGARLYGISGGPRRTCTFLIDSYVQLLYYGVVTATITRFRKDLFQLADHAINGEIVQFTYKGVVFDVKPEKKKSKLDKLVGQPVTAPGADLEKAGKELQAAMEAEWTKDWSKL